MVQEWMRKAAADGSTFAGSVLAHEKKMNRIRTRLIVGFLRSYAASIGNTQCDTFYGFSCNRGADMLGLHMFMSIK